MKVFVKETFPGNGRFHVTLDPDVSPEDLTRMKNALQKKKARFNRRKDVADLVAGEEILGSIVRVRKFLENSVRTLPCRMTTFVGEELSGRIVRLGKFLENSRVTHTCLAE